jgi:hypothetical protein
MADIQDIEDLEKDATQAEASPAVEDAAQASLPAVDPAEVESIEDAASAHPVNDSNGEDTSKAEDLAQASLPAESGPLSPQQQADVSNMVASSDRDDQGGDEPQSDDSDKQQPAQQPAANQPPPQVAQAIDSAIQNPQVREYLKAKYGFGPDLDDAAVKAAQDTAKQRMFGANLGRAADLAGLGFAQLGAGADWQKIKNDTSLEDAKDKEIAQPLQNILDRRKGILQDASLQTDQLKNQSLQDSVKSQLALSDPNSVESRTAQKAYLPILQKAGLDTSLLQNASAETIKTVLQQPLEFADKQKQSELVAKAQQDNKRLQMESNNLQREFNNSFKVQGFQDKQLQQSQAALNKDPQFVQASKSNDSINSALDTLELAKTNPVAFQANALDVAKTVLAGAGKLNQTEIKQFAGGSQALTDRLNQIYQQAQSGTITQDNYNFSKQLLQHLQNNNNQAIANVQQKYAGQLSSRNNADINQNLNKITGKQNSAPAQQPAAAPTNASPDTVQIITSDGQHLTLPKANLAAAQKRDPNLQVLQ